MEIDQKMVAVPILMYHHVNPSGTGLNVRPELFEAQIKFLKNTGYTTIGVEDLIWIFKGKGASSKKYIMLTFDDGWLDNWFYAFPILLKYSLKAVIFPVTSWMSDRPVRQNPTPLPTHKGCMEMVKDGKTADVIFSWQEAREMLETNLVEFGSHTHSHRRWEPDLGMPEKEYLEAELFSSKKLLEDNLGIRVNALCWPWGEYNETSKRVACDIGYKALFTTRKGT
ncbi:MAG: hypothetical protein D6726_05975, partial [Nitrospirae bacterium]